jgi:hypothetical protein
MLLADESKSRAIFNRSFALAQQRRHEDKLKENEHYEIHHRKRKLTMAASITKSLDATELQKAISKDRKFRKSENP